MLKVTASQMKVSSKPSTAKVMAHFSGSAAKAKRLEESDARAKAYRESRATALERIRTASREAQAAKEAEKRKPIRLWDNFEEVAVIQKSARLSFQISACTRDGFRCVTIREFYVRKRDGKMIPSKDGIMIPIAMPINRTKTPDPNNLPKVIHPMKEFILALQQAAEVAEQMELSNPDNAVWLRYNDKTEEKAT